MVISPPLAQWREQPTSNRQVLGSNPRGRAIFSPPNLALLEGYEPLVRWTHLIECHEMLVDTMTTLLEGNYHQYAVVPDQVEDTAIILASILTRNFRNDDIHALPRQTAQLANIIFVLPRQGQPGRVLKHRQWGTDMTQMHVNASIDNMITRIANLR